MKKLLLILILTINLQSWTKADDISDFEIAGMSIGDSLLDYFSEEDINEMVISKYPGSDKYIMLSHNSKTKFINYDVMSFHVKKNDNSFIIHSLKAGIYYRSNFKKCLDKKKEIIKDLKLIFQKTNTEEYDFKYKIDDGKSIAYANDFIFNNNDKIRAWCVNWSEVTENKRNFIDNLALSISPRYFLNWLNNEAKP